MRAQIEQGSNPKRQASQPSAPEQPFTRKKMSRANPTTQSSSSMWQCQGDPLPLYSSLVCASLVPSMLLDPTLLLSTLLYSTLPDSILRQCLLSYFSASGTCQLDFMIFGANSLLFRNMPTGLDLWSYFSTSGTCQLDLMVFWAMQNFLWLVFF